MWCVEVTAQRKPDVMRFLSQCDLLCNEYKIVRKGQLFLVPLGSIDESDQRMAEILSFADFHKDIILREASENLFIKEKRKKKTTTHPLSQIKQILENNDEWNRSLATTSFEGDWDELIPKKWKILGDIATLKQFRHDLFRKENIPQDALRELGKAFADVLHVRCVVGFSSGISGELRTPGANTVHVLALLDSHHPLLPGMPPTETIHQENGVSYCLDVQQVMFSPGNGTERLRAKSYFTVVPLSISSETVLDMFSGIGYFSLPMILGGRNSIHKLICIEKNPNSVHFLRKNFRFNHVDESLYEIYCGDNRKEANEWLGRVHRISLGYLPDTYPFLPRAFAFLQINIDCILHYHYLYDNESGEDTVKEHMVNAIQEYCSGKEMEICFHILEITVVKAYAPKVYHAVADIKVKITI